MEGIVKQFFELYLHQGLGQRAKWCDIPTQKNPLDAWIFQEIICETKPDIIIECGAACGGSALFMAMVMDRINHGRIITIEIKEMRNWARHPRITYLVGSSIDKPIIEQVQKMIKPDDKVMVILDSDHHKDHVYQEMITYAPMVTLGQYMIVEDTFWKAEDNLGPKDAVTEFIEQNPDMFTIDKEREKFLITYNPGGFLRRNYETSKVQKSKE